MTRVAIECLVACDQNSNLNARTPQCFRTPSALTTLDSPVQKANPPSSPSLLPVFFPSSGVNISAAMNPSPARVDSRPPDSRPVYTWTALPAPASSVEIDTDEYTFFRCFRTGGSLRRGEGDEYR